MLQLITAMIIWGTLGLFVLKSGLSSINIAFFRCLIGALFLAPYCFYKGYFSKSNLALKNSLPIFLGGVFVVLNWILLFESFRYASITLGNVSYYLQPVFLLVLARFFFKEEIPIIKYFFIFMTLVGVLLTLNLSTELLQLQSTELWGVVCALLAGFFYSLATIIAKKSDKMPAPMMTFLQLFIGTLMLLPITHFSEITINWPTASYILTLGIVHTLLAFVFYYNAVAKLSTDKIAVTSYVDPIAAIFTDILFFNRILLPIQVLGIFITLLSSYFVIDSNGIKRFMGSQIKRRKQKTISFS